MTPRQDLALLVTVYGICCVDEKISNILNLLCEGPQCAGARERAPRTLP